MHGGSPCTADWTAVHKSASQDTDATLGLMSRFNPIIQPEIQSVPTVRSSHSHHLTPRQLIIYCGQCVSSINIPHSAWEPSWTSL